MNNIRKLAFIGGGNMAAALISGLTKRGLSAERLVVADPSQDQLQRLVRDYAVQTAPDNASAVQGAEVTRISLADYTLPIYDADIQASGFPASALPLRGETAVARGRCGARVFLSLVCLGGDRRHRRQQHGQNV